MTAEGIISGQRVAEEKLCLAREMRRRRTPGERILWAHLRDNRLQGLHFRIAPAAQESTPGAPLEGQAGPRPADGT